MFDLNQDSYRAVLNTSYASNHQMLEVGAIRISVSQRSKLRQRKAKYLAQGHTEWART